MTYSPHERVAFLHVLMILTVGFAHREASAADAHAVDTGAMTSPGTIPVAG